MGLRCVHTCMCVRAFVRVGNVGIYACCVGGGVGRDVVVAVVGAAVAAECWGGGGGGHRAGTLGQAAHGACRDGSAACHRCCPVRSAVKRTP